MAIELPKAPEEKEAHLEQSWWQILLLGMLLYFLGLAVLAVTGNPMLFPTVLILGSFTVPVAYVAFFYDRKHLTRLSLGTVALSFVYGGIIGAFAASLLEPLFISQLSPQSVLYVGFVEEFAKILGVFVIGLHRRHTSVTSGVILGAAAGMGFAALESTGYSFIAFLRTHGNLAAIAEITVLRGLLSPLGHGTWTAILAAVLFHESKPGHFRLDMKVLLAYIVVSLLHAGWDALPVLADRLRLPGIEVILMQIAVSAVGVLALWRLWESGQVRQRNDTAAEEEIPEPGVAEE